MLYAPSYYGSGDVNEELPVIPDGDVEVPNKRLLDWEAEFGATLGRRLFRLSEGLYNDVPVDRQNYSTGSDDKFFVLRALAERIT